MSAWLALAAPPAAPELNGQENILAIHVAELTLEPNFQILRRQLRLEQTHRSAMGNHIPRTPRLGNRKKGREARRH
jgi:hypothetical protein